MQSGPVHPAAAMAMDEACFLGNSPPTLRFYQWNPHGVSLGYFQNSTDFDLAKFAAEGIPVVRRLTGGGAIFHGDELTFSLITDHSDPIFSGQVRESYDRIHDALARAFEIVCNAPGAVGPRRHATPGSDIAGSHWCFHKSTAFDLIANNKKIAGSAQRRAHGRILHHGSIVMRANRYTPEVAGLCDIQPHLTIAAVGRALATSFTNTFGIQLEPAHPTPDEQRLALLLAEKKYNNDDWNLRRIAPAVGSIR